MTSQAIERYIGRKVERIKAPDFNYQYTALFEEGKPGQPDMAPKIKGVRLSGGYFFGPARRRR